MATVASSPHFTALTTALTVYALFGDDFRLLFTPKAADPIFDVITIISMAIFALEIIICGIGQVGYLGGFFFWLDLVSTMTLVLDITVLAEYLFGDALSASTVTSSWGGDAAGGSTEPARAARMSRVGAKAGRVVRLIRIVRLVRFLKVFNRIRSRPTVAHPGHDVGDDDEEHKLSKESAVSKKLSEMTTRRVIILVLLIMLATTILQPSMYTETFDSTAKYSANVIFRRWCDDMTNFDPSASAANREAYLQSPEREIYEEDFVMNVYFHNWFCKEDFPDDKSEDMSPLGSFGRLFWIGVSPADLEDAQFLLPEVANRTRPSYDWNLKWNGDNWMYYQCNLPAEAQSILRSKWSETRVCRDGRFRGMSLLKSYKDPISCPEELRLNERTVIIPYLGKARECDSAVFMFVYDRRSGSRMEAALNSAQTVFICLLLGIGAMTFSKDANKLVLRPIERMIEKLDRIRSNPLEAMRIGDEEHHREQVKASKKQHGPNQDDGTSSREVVSVVSTVQQIRNFRRPILSNLVARCRKRWSRHSQVPEPMETVVLEKTIIKIGSLLALGFGEAGAEIIGQNMHGGDSAQLNAMIPGRKVDAIFGYCDIRNFTDATEVLQDTVMVFVNRIAGVVHSCTSEFFGNPNKNIGGAFLLVWRLSGHEPSRQQKLADMSLVSLIKMISCINKSPLLAEYRSHPKLAKRLPNYRVRMGFGLHSGWAIEGAIGSEFKIDASYLSPNVNMAARLEGVTKQFGCLLLINASVHRLMSTAIADECRLIDHVAMAGSPKPFRLYTLDLDDLALEVDKTISNMTKHAKLKARLERQRTKQERWADEFDIHTMFQNDPDIITMRRKYTTEFFCRSKMAYLNYEAGEWTTAKDMFEVTRFLLTTEDGPSAALLKFMRQYNWEAPRRWRGYRVLAER